MNVTNKMKERIEPLIGGIQIQNRSKGKGIGTMGCIVFDKETKAPLGLTNRHILKEIVGSLVVQPARKSRTKEFIIGEVLRKGKKGKSNDYAVFKLNTENRSYDKENSIYGLSGKINNIVEPEVGMKVQKVGQKTGHTFGIIHKIYKNGNFAIKPNSDKPVKQISKGGDSGSLWVTDEVNFKAVGLHKSGEKQPNRFRRKRKDRATAIPIQRILIDLNVTF